MFINEVDLLNLVVFGRAFYIGYKTGLYNELFKTFGILLATILSVHYCTSVGEFLGDKLIIAEKQRTISAFVTINVVIILISLLIREGWMMILKINAHSRLINWGGLIFAPIRGYLICGLIMLGLMISGSDFIMQRAYSSVSRIFFQRTAIDVYRYFYENVMVKLSPSEPLNSKLIDAVLAETDK